MKNWQDYATDAGTGRTKAPIEPPKEFPISERRTTQLEKRHQRDDITRKIRINGIILLLFVISMLIGLVWGSISFAQGGNPQNSVTQNIGGYIIGGALLGMLGPFFLVCQLFFLLTGNPRSIVNIISMTVYTGALIPAGVAILVLINAVVAGAQGRSYKKDPNLRRLARLNFCLALAPLLIALALFIALLILTAS